MAGSASERLEVVLGGAGFVGRHLAQGLEARGAEVLVVDLKTGQDLRVASPPVPRGRQAYIWFLAWDVGGAKFLLDESRQLEILQNNLLICQTVFPWIAEQRYSSTFVGSQMSGYRNAYGLTKQVGEYWAGLTPGCLIARLWNVYGLEESSERSHVLTDLVEAGRRGSVQCRTSGVERRQFLYVKDCVRALLHQRETGQPVADVTSGSWVTVRDLALTIARELGVPASFGPEPGYESLVEPAKPLRGWSPSYTLDDGIAEVLREAGLAGAPSLGRRA